MLAFVASASSLTAEETTPALRVLFIGDNDHHRPTDCFAQLEPVLRERGIQLVYTDNCDVLASPDLKAYPAVVLFANWPTITPAQEAGLLAYVEAGGGFVPVHCASFCFRNSNRFVDLVGAQFQSHGTGIMRTHIQAGEPLLAGFSGFQSFDETYIHTRHNSAGRTVLETRITGEQAPGVSAEPWTWIRKQGAGRVFYTAWGHDQRTWSHPGFHNLLERGIRFAAGDTTTSVPTYAEPGQFQPLPLTEISQTAATFEYVDVGPQIPNYTPSEKWGTQGEAKNLMQKPLSPSDSLAHYAVPTGFQLKLFASEPLIAGKPIAMNWDERGRLWLLETLDYPNERREEGPGRDRLVCIEDMNGDGVADKSTLFADGLSVPTTMTFAYGGVVVQNGAETLFLKDSDGDGVADIRHVLISNWNIKDTHACVSNFQPGLDNWIWGMQGYNNSQPVLTGGEKQPGFSMGFFRFRLEAQKGQLPVVSELEFVRSTNNNTWGLGFSEEGIVFGSTANGFPSVYMPVANRYYERVKGWATERLGGIADTFKFAAITSKVRQVDWHGGYTAAAGHALYTARNYPQAFWNQTAFVCEPTGHLVGLFHLQAQGSNFASTSPMNLVASDDEWAAPIMAEVGPDGNMWILDWYNYIVQHNPTPIGFETGAGQAYVTGLRDKKHGRVYKLVYQERPGSSPFPKGLSASEPGQLVAALKSDNLFWRRHGQRLLVERGKPDVVPELIALVKNKSVDAIGLNTAAIHSLRTLAGLRQVVPENKTVWTAVTDALGHPSAGVRKNAVESLPAKLPVASQESLNALFAAGLLADPHPQVRLAAALAIADRSGHGAGRGLAKAVQSPVDRWSKDGLTAAAAAHAEEFFVALGEISPMPNSPATHTVEIITTVAEHFARTKPTQEPLSRVVVALGKTSLELQTAALSGMAKGWPVGGAAVGLNAAGEKTIEKLLAGENTEQQALVVQLGQAWGSAAATASIDRIRQQLEQVVANETLPVEERLTAARRLVELIRTSPEVAASLLKWATPQSDSEFAVGLVSIVRVSRAENLGALLLETGQAGTPAIRKSVIAALLSRPQLTTTLLDGLSTGVLTWSDLSLDQKQALANHPDRAVKQRAGELLKLAGGLPNPDRQKVIEGLLSATHATGDATRGKAIYKQQCGKCHVHSGEGVRIGPELTGMAVHPKEELLVHILDPSRSLEGNFRLYTAVLKDGRVLSGMLAGETRTTLELIDTEAKRTSILREDLEELAASNKSLMPEGFEKQIPAEGFADLLAFLTVRGKYVPLSLAKVATAVSTRGLFYSSDNPIEQLVFSDWAPKRVGDVPFLLIDPEGTRVPNCVLLYGPQGTLPPQMPKMVSIPCRTPAKAIHLLSGVGGWSFPASPAGSKSLTVRLVYTDGQTEDHPLENGVHFADYIRQVDVEGSAFAFSLRDGQQMRYMAVNPLRTDSLDHIEFIKGPDDTAPVIMAVTLETP